METNPSERFRAWLQERAAARRLSHAQLAMRSGVDRSTVSRIINGSRSPTLDTAVRLIEALDGEEASPLYLRLGRMDDAAARIEHVLREDPMLSSVQRSELLHRYRAMRQVVTSVTGSGGGGIGPAQA